MIKTKGELLNEMESFPIERNKIGIPFAAYEAIDALYAEIDRLNGERQIDGAIIVELTAHNEQLKRENEELQTLIARQPACPLDFRALVEREVLKVVKISEFQHNPVNLDCPFPDKTEAAIRAAVDAICGEGK